MCQQKLCFEFKMFEWKSWSETKSLNKSLAATPNSTKKILVSNSKCLNESLALKINFQRKVVLLHQNVPTKTFFWIQNVCMKDLHWNRQNSYCETKLAQQKPCFEFKMFEWMSWSETKLLNKSLAAKPNSANKILVSNSKCLNETLLAAGCPGPPGASGGVFFYLRGHWDPKTQ